MGIKPSYIKSLGTELLAGQRDYFSASFDENKQQLGKSTIESKRVRKRDAGYITRKINTGRHLLSFAMNRGHVTTIAHEHIRGSASREP